MYSRIVVGIDGSELALKSLRHAVQLAKENKAKVYAVSATEPTVLIGAGNEMMALNTADIYDELEKVKAKSAETTLNEAAKIAKDANVEMERYHVPSTTPADAILDTANKFGASLIVMGSHGRRGLGRLLLGSQAAEVLARSTVAVLVVK
jgi:nucleotide-binding universal stress UspA family protein